MLVKNPGLPPDWASQHEVNSSTVSSIGFASKENILDYERLEKAESIGYDELKKILGLKKEEAHITVRDLSNSSRPVLFEYGLPSGDTSIVVRRYGLLNGSIVELQVSLYYSQDSFLTT